MWTGGVRVILLDNQDRMLLVRQHHENRDIWMVPGGCIEEGESAADAAIREVKEETGLDIEIKSLIWHVEEVSDRGQRFVNFFMGRIKDDPEAARLGFDPEYGPDNQVLREVRFMSKSEMLQQEIIYPLHLKDEFWQLMDSGEPKYNAFRMRDNQ